MSSPQVLERIERARVAQQKAEAELAVLVDQAVGLGISWPQIDTRLGEKALTASRAERLHAILNEIRT